MDIESGAPHTSSSVQGERSKQKKLKEENKLLKEKLERLSPPREESLDICRGLATTMMIIDKYIVRSESRSFNSINLEASVHSPFWSMAQFCVSDETCTVGRHYCCRLRSTLIPLPCWSQHRISIEKLQQQNHCNCEHASSMRVAVRTRNPAGGRLLSWQRELAPRYGYESTTLLNLNCDF